jgi:4-hydroxyproline epimerase
MVNSQVPLRLNVVDSHTAGEPTRCVVSGGPEIGSAPLSERRGTLRRDHDAYRRAILFWSGHFWLSPSTHPAPRA